MPKGSVDDEKTLSELINELSKEIGDVDATGSVDDKRRSLSKSHDQEIAATGSRSSEKYATKYRLSAFPTEMSCTQAFNDLVECYSLGGQLRRVYRFGGINDCKEQKLKAKFCIFNKLNSKDVQKQKVARFYMEKLARQKMEKGSSEDIWKVRQEPLVDPFKAPEEE